MCRGTISFANGAIEVEATVIAEALDLPPEVLMTMVRSGQITSLCERGVDADAGHYRLTFFHKSKRLRFVVDGRGQIIRRSTIDFGDRPLPTQSVTQTWSIARTVVGRAPIALSPRCDAQTIVPG